MIFSREGFKALRFVYGVTLAGFGVAIFLAAGSYWYWQAETKSAQQSQRSLQELRSRVDSLKRERDDLRNSDNNFKVLTARGAFLPEQRLDLVEALNELKIRHKLISIEYEVAPQRVLRMASGESFPAIDVLGSRIKMKIRAYHDGDLLAFLDEFPRMQRGFFPLDRCTIKRATDSAQASVTTSGSAAGQPPNELEADATRKEPLALLDAECVADWVTVADKAKPRQAQAEISSPIRL